MKNVSSAFREELKKDNRNYIKSADITLKSGIVLKIDNSDLWQNGMKLDTATSSANSFDLGAIITGQLTLTLNNIDEKFTDYDFTDCTATNVKVGLKLPDGTTESLSYGKFYLNDAKYNGSIITLTFYDGIYKFDRPYSKSNLTYPATLGQILRDACSVCDVPMGTVEFDNDDYVVQSRPDDKSLTFRQVLKWIGEISVHYFCTDEEGRLSVGWYDLESQNNQIEETILQDTDGENILDTNNNEIITSIESGIRHFVSLSVGLDDVVITGVRVLHDVEGDSGTETITYQAGSDGYLIEISKNKLIQGDEGTNVANMVAAKLVGLRFRAYQATGLSDPTREVGDTVWLIDRKNNRYKSVITNNTFQPGNFQNFSCGAVSPARNSATRYSQITQVYVDYRKDIEKERTDREKALDELTERIDGSSGLFTTEEIQEDGSTIFYLHNKPMLSESDIIWKMTAEAWGVSTDGGKTYNAGMTVDGDTIVRILTAVGVNADWIKTGAISVEDTDGNETFYVDTETGQVRIVANSFSLKGKSISEIADEEVNDFIDNVYSPAIANLQSQIDGQIETWFYNYVPTTSNAPASNWTTDSEKERHLGDLFYVVDNEEYGGQAYRWAKINNAYTWDYVEDTAVVKALADAADAKDTADQKRRVFVSTPYPPYDVGDLWAGDDTSDLMRCQTARSTGSFNSSDWIKAVKYTDDSELYDFIQGDYTNTIEEIKEQSDQKAETWYQSTDPSLNWNAEQKAEHIGDMWYNTTKQKSYRWDGSAWQEMKTTPPDEVYDQIDGKAQIFISQPVPPYAIGDLWFNSSTSDIMTCISSRSSGNYTASDWEKRNKYTDDSYAELLNQEFNQFVSGYQTEINEIQNSIDQKSEVWYQPTDPALEWTENENTALMDSSGNNILDTTGDTIETVWEKEKYIHDGDLWKDSDTNVEYIYQNGIWVEMPIPDDIFDTIDGKAQIFVTQPVPPYSVGDLWFNSSTSDIMTCINGRESGSYASSDWQKRNKYTDDSYAEEVAGDLSNFADQVVGDLENIQTQIDGKIETYYYDYQPTLSNIPASAWTTEEERQKHIGDLFYWKSKGFTYRFLKDGSTWKWQAIKDSDIDEALSQASTAQDTADGKRRVFTSTPTPPYDVGDLWAQGGSGDIMRCIRSRSSGNYTSSDWEKASKYTDDSAVEDLDHSLDKQGVFNRLTNYGEVKGIFLESDGQLYINASYLMTGILKVSQPGASGKETFYANMDTGEVRIVANSFSLTNGDTIDSIAQGAVDELDDSLTQTDIFNRLTNNGQAHGITLHQNGQLYINAEYIQSLILKVGGANNENGTFEVYNGNGVLVGKIDKDGAKFTNGSDWLQIQNSLMTGGYGGTTDGLLDLSANYSGGERHVVLESKTGDVILKSSGDFLVERTGTGQGTLLQSGNYQYLTDVGDVEITSSETEELRAIALGESVARDASNNPIDALALIRKDTLSKVFYEGDYFSYFSSHIITGWRFVSLTTPTTIAPGYSWDLTANAAGSGIPTRTGTEYLVIPISTGWGAVGSIDQPSSGNTNFTVSVLNNGSSAHTIGCTCLVLGLLSRDLSPLA